MLDIRKLVSSGEFLGYGVFRNGVRVVSFSVLENALEFYFGVMGFSFFGEIEVEIF